MDHDQAEPLAHGLKQRGWVTLGGLGGVLLLMLTDGAARPQVLWSGAATGAVLAVAMVREPRARGV